MVLQPARLGGAVEERGRGCIEVKMRDLSAAPEDYRYVDVVDGRGYLLKGLWWVCREVQWVRRG